MCVSYWKEKRSFLQKFQPTTSVNERKMFLQIHQSWSAHLRFAYNERSYYKSKKIKARETWKDIQMMRGFDEIDEAISGSWLHLSIDAMRIRYLPNIGCGPQAHTLYFLKKLKIYLIGIINESNGEGTGFLWDETLKPTTTNHVATCLWMYLLLCGRGEERLRLTLDNCGVNKSYVFVAFVVTLVIFGFFETVDLCWLVAGHTKFSPDQIFGIISSSLKLSDV